MAYRFEQTYRVRYDECNLYGLVTPVAVLRYLQDIAALDAVQSTLIGTGDWVARRTIMEFHAPIPARAHLRLQTYPLGFTKVTAWRGYDLLLAGDAGNEPQLAVKARTLWVYLDARGRPTRIPPDMLTIWMPPGTTLVLPPDEETWPTFPAQPQFETNAPVRFSDLDVMGHMNNAAYVELLDNATWEIFTQNGLLPQQAHSYPAPLYYDIEYAASARPGETLQVHSWFEPIGSVTPLADQTFERLQRVQTDATVLVRARSRWQWQ